jgi:hypothetical protein
MAKYIKYEHKSSVISTLGEFVFQNGLSVAFDFSGKEKELYDYEDNAKSITKFYTEEEFEILDKGNYKALPLKVGTFLKIPTSGLKTAEKLGLLAGISDGFIYTSNIDSFFSDELAKIITDETRLRFEEDNNKGTFISQNTKCSVYAYSKALKEYINLSDYLISVNTVSNMNSSTFNIRVVSVQADKSQEDEKWVISQKFNKVYYQNKTNSKQGLNLDFFSTVLQKNDLIFIKNNADEHSGNLILVGTDVAENENESKRNYELIGTISEVDLSTDSNGASLVSISGSDCLTLLAEDSCHFYPEEYSGGAFINDAKYSSGSGQERDRLLKRIFANFQVLGLYLERDIAYTVNFIVNALSYLGLHENSVFNAWGNRISRHWVSESNKSTVGIQANIDEIESEVKKELHIFMQQANTTLSDNKTRYNDKQDIINDEIRKLTYEKLDQFYLKSRVDNDKFNALVTEERDNQIYIKKGLEVDFGWYFGGVYNDDSKEFVARRKSYVDYDKEKPITTFLKNRKSESEIKSEIDSTINEISSQVLSKGHEKGIEGIVSEFRKVHLKTLDINVNKSNEESFYKNIKANERDTTDSTFYKKAIMPLIEDKEATIVLTSINKKIVVRILPQHSTYYIFSEEEYVAKLSNNGFIKTDTILDNYNDVQEAESKKNDIILHLETRLDKLHKDYTEKTTRKTENSIVSEPMNGLYQIFKVNIDKSAEIRKIVDSSLTTQKGSMLDFFRKISDNIFVEMFGDTYGDMFHLNFRQPPFNESGYKSLIPYAINIRSEELMGTSLSFDSRSYSWYVLRPQASFLGESDKTSLAFFPAIHFNEYANVYGNRPYEVTSNYVPYLPSNSGADQDLLKYNYFLRQGFFDLKYLIDSTAYLPFSRRGTIRTILLKNIKKGCLIRLEATGELFYVTQVSHNYSIHNAGTTITVERGLVEKHLGKYFNVIETPITDEILKKPKVETKSILVKNESYTKEVVELQERVALSKTATLEQFLNTTKLDYSKFANEYYGFDKIKKKAIKHTTTKRRATEFKSFNRRILSDNKQGWALFTDDNTLEFIVAWADESFFPQNAIILNRLKEGKTVGGGGTLNSTKKLGASASVPEYKTVEIKEIEPFPSGYKDILKNWKVNEDIFNFLIERNQYK